MRLNTTPTPFGSCLAWILLLNSPPSNITLEPRFPQTYENHPNEGFTPSNRTIAKQHPCNSIAVPTSDTREWGNLENKVNIAEVDEQATGEMGIAEGGGEAVMLPYGHPHPNPQTSVRAKAAGGLVAALGRASSPSVTSRSTSTTPNISHCSAPNLRQGPTLLPPRSISLPQAFANATSQPPTSLSSKGQPSKRSVLSNPFRSLSAAQKRPSTASKQSLEAHTQGFRPSYVKPPTAPTPQLFEDRLDEILAPLNSPIAAYRSFGSTSTHVDDARGLGDLKNNAKIVGTTGHSNPMGDEEDFVSSLRIDMTPTLSASYLTLFPSDRQPLITPLESTFPQKCEKSLDEAFTSPDAAIPAQRFYNLTFAHTDDTKERGSLKDDVKVVEIKEQVTRETDVSQEGEDGEHIAARTSSSSTSSRSYLIAPHISNSTPNLHRGSTTSFLCSSPNTMSQPSTRKGQCVRRFVSPTPFHPSSTAQKRPSKARPRNFRPPLIHSPINPPFQQRSFDFQPIRSPLDISQPCQVEPQSEGPLSSIMVDGAGNTTLSTHTPSPTFQPYGDKRPLLEGPPSPILMDNASDLPSPVHDPHSNSPLALSRNHPASLHSSLPSPLSLKSRFPQNAVRCFYNSTTVRTDETWEPGHGKDNAKAVGIDEQVSREAEVAGEGENVTEVPGPANEPSPKYNNSSLSMHNAPSISFSHPPCDLYHYSSSFYSCPSSPFPPKRRWASPSPSFCRRRSSGSHNERTRASTTPLVNNKITSGRVPAPASPTSPSTSSNRPSNSVYDKRRDSLPNVNDHALNASRSNPGAFSDAISSVPTSSLGCTKLPKSPGYWHKVL